MQKNSYGKKFYTKNKNGSQSSAAVVIALVKQMLRPMDVRSVVDFGCGVGAWLAQFDSGTEKLGIDWGGVRQPFADSKKL